MNNVFINDRVVKKILNSEEEECREYLSRIISGVLKIDVNIIKDNIELIEPEVGSNINTVNSIVDVIYKSDNKYFNIEINYNNKRIVTVKNNIYIYHMLLRQVKKQSDYSNILPIIQININNYDLFKEGRFIYESSIREKVSHKKRDELITIYDINLEYLKKIDYNKIIERNYNLEKILYIFICNNKNILDYIYKGDKVMEKVREDAEVITRGLDDILYYDPVMLEEQANEYERKIAREEGFNEGREEGKKEGIKENQKEMIKNMLDKNMDLNLISDITKISIKEIEKMKETL